MFTTDATQIAPDGRVLLDHQAPEGTHVSFSGIYIQVRAQIADVAKVPL